MLHNKRLTENQADDYAYPWKKAINLDADKKIMNAESYAFYAYIARCADKGYKLKMDGVDDAAKRETLSKGDMIYDENLERVGGEQEVPQFETSS